jgi:hypothetical protein
MSAYAPTVRVHNANSTLRRTRRDAGEGNDSWRITERISVRIELNDNAGCSLMLLIIVAGIIAAIYLKAC